jgi:hypothetical protein
MTEEDRMLKAWSERRGLSREELEEKWAGVLGYWPRLFFVWHTLLCFVLCFDPRQKVYKVNGETSKGGALVCRHTSC